MNMIAIARPYAQAAFEHAQASKTLSDWSQFLNTLKAVFLDASISKGLKDPRVGGQSSVANAIQDVFGKHLPPAQINFLNLLAENKRLQALPDIADEFTRLQRTLNHSMTCQVQTARLWDADLKSALKNQLEQRFEQAVQIEYDVSPALIGGMVIHHEDTVWDSSLKARLDQLEQQLKREHRSL
jgi:F-type H+-transporting ATPase subunit delta